MSNIVRVCDSMCECAVILSKKETPCIRVFQNMNVCVCVYIYIHIYVYIQKEIYCLEIGS